MSGVEVLPPPAAVNETAVMQERIDSLQRALIQAVEQRDAARVCLEQQARITVQLSERISELTDRLRRVGSGELQ